jgi:hypothetical protein
MRSKVIASRVLTVGIVTPTVLLFAHHGTGVAYDTEKVVTLTGTVTEWIWANPHCGLLFDVKDDSGNVVHWGAELTNPHALSEAGFSKDIFKPGDMITISGHLAKSGAPRMESSRIVLANGRVLPERHVKGNGLDEPSR